MRERLEWVLKMVCIGLAVLLAVQLVKVAVHMNPLAGVTIPDLPSLPPDTNAPPKMAEKGPGKSGTNAPPVIPNSKTDTALAAAATNATPHPKTKEGESNAVSVQIAAEQPTTNRLETNILAGADTNTVAPKAATDANTNLALTKTNGVGRTNSVAAKPPRSKNADVMAAMMGGPGGKKASTLPPEIQARVDRVTESEILAPVIRPMPMALLGIAGNVAFLRSPSGQTGLVKEGDDLGEIKLLKIGTNRVLVEQNGEKKELMIFSGFGGESLLSKSTENSDETTKK